MWVGGGCSGDDVVGRHDNDATLVGDVAGGDTAGPAAIAVEISAPTPNEEFIAGSPVDVVGRATLTSGSAAGLAWRVETDETVAGHGAKTGILGPNGDFAVTLTSLGGGERTITVTIDPDGVAPATAAIGVLVRTPAAAPEDVRVTPSAPDTTSDLVAKVEPDPADGVTVSYRWSRDGEQLATGPRLDHAKTAKGDVITVSAWYVEGGLAGQVVTADVTIGNAAPSCAQVRLTPSGLATSDKDLTCACVAFDDPDEGDADASRCAFYDDADDGALVDTAGSCTLPAADTDKGMEIRCVLTPGDGTSSGAGVEGATTTGISNSPPKAPEVTLEPATADAESDLSCVVTPAGEAVDVDGDAVTYQIAWLVNGDAVAGATAANTTGVDLGAVHGDAVSCRVQASDGQSTSAAVTSDALVLDDAAPDLVNVFVVATPQPATKASTLTCAPQDGADADGDALSYVYTWSIDGVTITGADEATLASDAFARGDKVSCTATACDPGGACSATVNAKLTVVIGNAPPTVDGVEMLETPGYGGADGVAQPEDVLTCTYDATADLDGDAVSVVYGFYLVAADGAETELQSGADPDFTVPEGLPVGAILRCAVTPADDGGEGAAVQSPGLEVVSPTPIAPTVTVAAPSGAEGDVTCSVTDPGRWLPSGAAMTTYWSVNGAAEVAGGATLSGDDVLSCDLLACRVEVGAGAAAVSSNTASLQLALGDDCEDGNPCTGMACLAGGGCKATLISGPSCDDGDPCTVDDVCSSGVCTAGLQTCVEDRLSTALAATGRPVVGAAADGGYAVTFMATGGQLRVRRTDGTASRTDEEAAAAAAGDVLDLATPPVDAGAGRVAILRTAPVPYVACNCGGYWPFGVYLRVLDVHGAAAGEVSVFDFRANAALGPHGGIPRILSPRAALVGFSDGGFGAFGAYTSYGGYKRDLVYTYVGADLMAEPAVSLVPSADLFDTALWDAAAVLDGSDHVALVWVASDHRTVRMQRFTRAGTTEDAAPVDVVVAPQDVTRVRVVGTRAGRVVVLWESNGLDGSGYGVMAQRYDDGGAALGAAFGATAAVAGDQRLGGVAALDNHELVVVYSDASAPGAAVARAQRISSSGQRVGEAVRMNVTSTLGASPPTVARLDSDEWVGVWSDAAGAVWTRRFTASGELAPRVAERRVAQTTTGDQQDGAAAREASGNTLVAWSSPVYIGLGDEIVARVFDAAGVAVGGEIAVNSHVAGVQSSPAVAGGADRFVVAWTSEDEDGSVEGVFARRFDGAGAPLGEAFGVPETTADTQRHPAVAMAPGGGFVVAWSGYTDATDGSDVYLRSYAADGAAVTGELRVNGSNTAGTQERPAIAQVPFSDTYLVTWQTRHVSANGYDIYVRKVKADGTLLSPELRVNTVTEGDQRAPALGVSQADATAVCWTSAATAGGDVVCQLLKTSTLAAQGAPFSAHAALPGTQEAPRLTWLSSGRLLVAYASESLDHDGFAVQTARFDNLGQAVAPRRTVNRRWDGDQRAPWLVAYDEAVFVGYQSDDQDGDGIGLYFRRLPVGD
ncbi:MAG: hypothetical protein CVU56_26105 [Deltaproteobacteria bacterium HGW-Deltaproteobacteria-14]|nr:MAG: hypothetical protein CVU56_26105 [Deltaproteobacteria bacterium HGW-Deltaproteobacteria-14]